MTVDTEALRSPAFGNGAAGVTWYCGCLEELMPEDAHGVRWCRGLDEKHAWKRTHEGDWLLIGRASYDRLTKRWGVL